MRDDYNTSDYDTPDDSEELGGGAMVVVEKQEEKKYDDDTSNTPLTDLQILALHPDPSKIGWPPTLPVELALGRDSAAKICSNYNISKEQFIRLTNNAVFQKAFADAREMLTRESVSFRAKARLQSELLLPESWRMIHSQHTPAAVRARLIEATWRVAGFEPKGNEVLAGQNLQININLG